MQYILLPKISNILVQLFLYLIDGINNFDLMINNNSFPRCLSKKPILTIHNSFRFNECIDFLI